MEITQPISAQTYNISCDHVICFSNIGNIIATLANTKVRPKTPSKDQHLFMYLTGLCYVLLLVFMRKCFATTETMELHNCTFSWKHSIRPCQFSSS